MIVHDEHVNVVEADILTNAELKKVIVLVLDGSELVSCAVVVVPDLVVAVIEFDADVAAEFAVDDVREEHLTDEVSRAVLADEYSLAEHLCQISRVGAKDNGGQDTDGWMNAFGLSEHVVSQVVVGRLHKDFDTGRERD